MGNLTYFRRAIATLAPVALAAACQARGNAAERADVVSSQKEEPRVSTYKKPSDEELRKRLTREQY